MRSEIETTDIFRGAFLLCSGCEIRETKVNNGGQVVFSIDGDGVQDINRRFSTGYGLVNPLQFRETLNMMRDLVFEKVRTEDRRYKYAHSPRRH